MHKKLYERWLSEVNDQILQNELKNMQNNEDEILNSFYKNLEFGTAGLRGIIGAGTNRMNIYTVAHATQGLAEYINSVNKNGSVAIAYDSRINSELFAKKAASVFAANGVKVYIYKELMPTPMLSFAVRELKCDAGVVITASHNPSKYNGYKAYGSDGCQLGPKESEYVTSIINKADIFNDVKDCDFNEALDKGLVEYIEQNVIDAYLNNVLAQSCIDKNYNLNELKIIYSPLHGTGNKPVRAILNKIGIKNVKVVKEQEKPDGNFPTVKFPNPEFKETFDLALNMTKDFDADILLATDPDSDRVGVAIKNNSEYTLLNGNEIGVLMLNYLLLRKTELNTLPNNPVAVKTIVSTELCKPICNKYGCTLIDVLTGFKFIGEQILLLEQKGEENRYILGFEESYGYLSGSYVRDKDAVVGSMLICEMVAYYKAKGMNLLQVLDELYKEFGYYKNLQHSITCEGISGMEDMKRAMNNLSNNPPKEIAGINVVSIKDYKNSLSTNLITNEINKINLPSSNVLAYELENKSTVTVRPSGTEPKIKIYVSAVSENEESANNLSILLRDSMINILGL